MCFYRILEVIKTVMPLFTGIGAAVVTGLVIPVLMEWWKIRKVRCCHNALFSRFDKICRSFGRKTYPTIREERFETDADLERLIALAKGNPDPADAPGWRETNLWQFRTGLNIARTQAGLGSGNFFYSRHFRNNQRGELLLVLTVKDNTVEIRAFCKGKWDLPKSKTRPALYRIKVKLFGYDHPDYSIMLV